MEDYNDAPADDIAGGDMIDEAPDTAGNEDTTEVRKPEGPRITTKFLTKYERGKLS